VWDDVRLNLETLEQAEARKAILFIMFKAHFSYPKDN